MQVALSHPGPQRWLLPIVLGVLVTLVFAALPGGPFRILAKDALLAKQVRAEITMVHMARTVFQQARDHEPGVLSGVSRALDRIAGDASPDGEAVAALRDAIVGYDQALRQVRAVPSAEPSDVIELTLGQLQAGDEARLREPLLAMRLAEAAMLSEPDPRSADQVSHWAGVFAARLAGMAIPEGTRSTLLARLAAYENGVLGTQGSQLRQQSVQATLQAAAQTVDTALGNADRVLTAERQRLNKTFAAAFEAFARWFGAALAASLTIVALGAFGRTAFGLGLARTWHAR